MSQDVCALQPMSSFDLAYVAIKGAERGVPGLSSDFNHQAIGKSDAALPPELCDGGRDSLRILNGQMLMIQQHLDGRRDRRGLSVVDGGQNP